MQSPYRIAPQSLESEEAAPAAWSVWWLALCLASLLLAAAALDQAIARMIDGAPITKAPARGLVPAC